jgi:hypothetical protein
MSAIVKPPVWFWVVAVIAILWNLLGVYAYLADVMMSPEKLADYREEEQALIAGRPGWLFGVYAIAVFGGLIGSAALALRKAFAAPVFAVSLAAILIQMGYVFFGMNALSILGLGAAVFPAIICLIGAFLLWFSMQSKSKDWIG